MLKNRCFQTVGLGKTLKESFGQQGEETSQPKGNQSWIFLGRADAEAETPILWPPDVKSQLTGKDPDAGKDWRQEEKGTTEDEMIGWHHWLNGHECEHTLRNSKGQGSLVCCSPWCRKESDTTEEQQQKEASNSKVVSALKQTSKFQGGMSTRAMWAGWCTNVSDQQVWLGPYRNNGAGLGWVPGLSSPSLGTKRDSHSQHKTTTLGAFYLWVTGSQPHGRIPEEPMFGGKKWFQFFKEQNIRVAI